ncbi:Putative fatty-acid--CoA ligase FadD21 [Seminavis robusta]|uniref:Fatty-acid--CoA ligase FadD21 n=1 Tax=Seminavis robusta TaxID=568900 RepID=A0A9N8H5R4_9STRA|nr:Putative fatty-acid--CoA ligase FadD21 [Seminavis robusta]|eukprot:Sro93_g048440.1 Putative fatty-acid--CoA ligase FadD21 (627) ;mRNA; r:43710-45590
MGIEKTAVASMYGLAEHVLAATSGASPHATCSDLRWSIGNLEFSRMIGGVDVRVVDPDSCKLVPEGVEGEIWLSSPCVSAGYWGKPELSNSEMKAKLDGADTEDLSYLRTGDIGFIRENELYFVSRLKDLIIMNGKNIAPSDVERAAETGFPDKLRPGSSCAFQATPESAVLLCEARENFTKNPQALDSLAQKVLLHVEENVSGIKVDEVRILKKGSVYKTTSGKVKRKAMKSRWECGELPDPVGTTPSLDSKCSGLHRAATLEELFSLAGAVDPSRTLVENGIDSMQLVALEGVAREKFQVQLSFSQASSLTVEELLVSLREKQENVVLSIPTNPPFDSTLVRKLIPSRILRVPRQTVVLLLTFVVIFVSIMPSAVYIKHNWHYKSEWWIHNSRTGPLVFLAIPIWMATYSAACIAIKWLLLGRIKADDRYVMWSGVFARWWTVTRLVAVWEATVGHFLSDTPIRNVFYNLMGSNIAITARLHTPIRCWDLVTIGAKSEIKGHIFPRTMHWTGAYFQEVVVGSESVVGSGAVVMAGSNVASRVRIESRTVVPPGGSLKAENAKWSGLPATMIESESYSPSPTLIGPLGLLLRCLTPFALFALMVIAWWVANEIGPSAPEPSVSSS